MSLLFHFPSYSEEESKEPTEEMLHKVREGKGARNLEEWDPQQKDVADRSHGNCHQRDSCPPMVTKL